MRLIRFRVRDFRSVVDSDGIEVERVGEAVLALGSDRHALMAMEGAAGAKLGDQFLPLRGVGLLGRARPERTIIARLAQRSGRARRIPDQGLVERLPDRPAIRANGELAPIEFDVMIGVQVYPRALALRAAIGGAGDCFGGLGGASRAAVRRPPDLEAHRHAPPPIAGTTRERSL